MTHSTKTATLCDHRDNNLGNCIHIQHKSSNTNIFCAVHSSLKLIKLQPCEINGIWVHTCIMPDR